jgi:hypothetical protein
MFVLHVGLLSNKEFLHKVCTVHFCFSFASERVLQWERTWPTGFHEHLFLIHVVCLCCQTQVFCSKRNRTHLSYSTVLTISNLPCIFLHMQCTEK